MTKEEIIRNLKYTMEKHKKNTVNTTNIPLMCKDILDYLEQEPCEDAISRQAAIDALHTWFRDGFDEDKWWNSTHALAAIEGIPSVHQKHKWETCFECPLSHGCPKIKGCTNEQAMEYASKIPNDCPLSAPPVNPQPNKENIHREREQAYMCGYEDGSRKYRTEQSEDAISRQAAINEAFEVDTKEYGRIEVVGVDAIESLPPVNPQPKTGRWIAYEVRVSDRTILNYRCSVCGRRLIGYNTETLSEVPFCHCGAKMVEPQERKRTVND